MDLTKYRNLFIEEASEHLAEMSRSLLALEKDLANGEAIDCVFRMAHGIKGMAASLEFHSISEVAHRLEDRMSSIRSARRATSGEEVALLFRGLEVLEAMLGVVRETGDAPPPDFPPAKAFCSATAPPEPPAPAAPKKKLLRPL